MSASTIFAVASPPGPAPRAVVRISGPRARTAVASVFAPSLPAARAQVEGCLLVRGRSVPALALHMPGPHSYTGEDVVELHVPGSAMLLAEVAAVWTQQAAALDLRSAAPGEFTRRAFANGRIDLAQAEGVLLLIHAADQREQSLGLQWLQGGLSRTLDGVRSELQEALALVEAGLDFTDGETGAVDEALWRAPLDRAVAALRAAESGLPAALPGGEILLLGAANAGKSSLCNALAGRSVVLVDAGPGTTRDLIRVELAAGVAIWDSPGDLAAPTAVDRAALELRQHLSARAAAAVLVVDPSHPHVPATRLPWLCVVHTKADRAGRGEQQDRLAALPPELQARPHFVVSAQDGSGIAELRAFLLQRAASGARDAGAPVRTALGEALAAAARAAAAPFGSAGELVGLDLQTALAALSRLHGSHQPDDLLDRIFGRFCLGK